MKDKITLAIISSPGHSGQTWLSMLIGSHSQALALGEIATIYGLRDLSKVCMLCGEGCEFWKEFNKVWKSEENIFPQLAAFSNKHVLSISGIGKYSKHITHDNLIVKVIRLIRDGRAVTASYFRKYPERTYEDIIRQWVYGSNVIDNWIAEISPENRMTLRYEDLLRDTAIWVNKICAFLEIDFEVDMMKFWKVKHHIVSGNRGTLSFVQRQFGLGFDPVDKNFYALQDPNSFKDERWRSELSRYHLYLFEKIGGNLNEQYGYNSIEKASKFSHAARYLFVRSIQRLKKIVS